MDGEALEVRLDAAGVVDPDTDAVAAWRALRRVEGAAATVIDLYALVARARGIQPDQLPRDERLALARSVLPDVWPGFELTAGSERVGDPIQVVAYDPGWPDAYDAWRGRIESALGATAVRVEHVGSTSVPGLPAKPIIDVQVSVVDLADEASYLPQLETLGLQLRSRDEMHRYLRPRPDQPRSVHVHVCAAGSAWEREHLLFRDWLRLHEDARRAYAAAKREAARRWSDDRLAYTDAKSGAILAILAAAQRDTSVPPDSGRRRAASRPPP